MLVDIVVPCPDSNHIFPLTNDGKVEAYNAKTGEAINVPLSHLREISKEPITDRKGIFKIYSLQAAKGDANGMYALATLHFAGEGTSQNTQQAIHWFRKAAEQGHRLAMLALSNLLFEGDDQKLQDEAFKWLKAAAEKGEPTAQIWLGNYYLDGHQALGKDIMVGRDWLIKAARSDKKIAKIAQFDLAMSYISEEPQDFKKADLWIFKAAMNEHPKAALQVSEWCPAGSDLSKQWLRYAFKWLELSKEQKLCDYYKWPLTFQEVIFEDKNPGQPTLNILDLWKLTEQLFLLRFNKSSTTALETKSVAATSTLQPADQKSDPSEQYEYAKYLEERNQLNKALKFYKWAATGGHVEAQEAHERLLKAKVKPLPLAPGIILLPVAPAETIQADHKTPKANVAGFAKKQAARAEESKMLDQLDQLMSRANTILQKPENLDKLTAKEQQQLAEIEGIYQQHDKDYRILQANLGRLEKALYKIEQTFLTSAEVKSGTTQRISTLLNTAPLKNTPVPAATSTHSANMDEMKGIPRKLVIKDLEQLQTIIGKIQSIENLTYKNRVVARAALFGATATLMDTIKTNLSDDNIIFRRDTAEYLRNFIYHDESTYQPFAEDDSDKKNLDEIIDMAQKIMAHIKTNMYNSKAAKDPTTVPSPLLKRILGARGISDPNFSEEIGLARRERELFRADEMHDILIDTAVQFIAAREGAAESRLARKSATDLSRAPLSIDQRSTIAAGAVIRHGDFVSSRLASATHAISGAAAVQKGFFASPPLKKGRKKAARKKKGCPAAPKPSVDTPTR
jgi:TPR repeat protein